MSLLGNYAEIKEILRYNKHAKQVSSWNFEVTINTDILRSYERVTLSPHSLWHNHQSRLDFCVYVLRRIKMCLYTS